MKQPLLSPKNRITHPFISLIPYFKRKRISFLCALVITLLCVACMLTFAKPKNSSFLPYKQNINILSHHDGLHVVVDDTVLDPVLKVDNREKLSSSIDGRTAAFLTDAKELYLVQDHELKKIADDVIHFEISSSGMGVAFAQKYAQQYALTLYDPASGTRKEITASLSRLDFSLSPDGQSVAYYTEADDSDVLMCHRKGKELTICREKSDLVGLSDDGTHIYAVCPKITGTSALFAFNHKGKSTELGPVTSISFKFNANHRQIMFYNNGKTMISTNGQQALKISSNPLYLVTAPNSNSASDGNSITLPVKTLFDHVYTCSDGESTSAWLIHKDPAKSKRLVSRVSGCTLDASGEYLYYIHDLSQLCVMKISNGSSLSQTLAENVDNYVVSSDRNKVFYTSEEALYCTNGKRPGTPRLIAQEVASYNLAMSASDTMFYLSGSDLYIYKNKRRSILAAQNIQTFYCSPNNAVYIIGDDEIYAAYTKKQPVKILEAA